MSEIVESNGVQDELTSLLKTTGYPVYEEWLKLNRNDTEHEYPSIYITPSKDITQTNVVGGKSTILRNFDIIGAIKSVEIPTTSSPVREINKFLKRVRSSLSFDKFKPELRFKFIKQIEIIEADIGLPDGNDEYVIFELKTTVTYIEVYD